MGLVGLLLILTLLMLIRLITRHQERKVDEAHLKTDLFMSTFKPLPEEESSINYELEDRVLQYHFHRLYLMGNNTPKHPWKFSRE